MSKFLACCYGVGVFLLLKEGMDKVPPEVKPVFSHTHKRGTRLLWIKNVGQE